MNAGIASLEVRARIGRASVGEQPALLHELPLTADPEQVAASFRASVRRNIRTAERSPAVLRVASTESDLTETFYRLHVDVRRRLGLPVQPRRFFRLLWSRMKQVVEPSSATALAAVLRHRERFADQRVGVLLSGGNVDLDALPALFAAAADAPR